MSNKAPPLHPRQLPAIRTCPIPPSYALHSLRLLAELMMRFGLVDLLAHTLVGSFFLLCVLPFAKGSGWLGGMMMAALVVLSTASACSYIYQYFTLFALVLPKCPRCADSNRHYLCISQKWPAELHRCCKCKQTILTVHDSKHSSCEDTESPVFIVLWPWCLGIRWKRLQ